MNKNDQELIDECLAGQSEAFGQLVLRYQDRLHNTLWNLTGSADDARDAAQDAFVHAFQKLDSFRGQSAFYTWLFRIAYNAAITLQRKQRRQHNSIETTREKAGIEPTDASPDAAPSHAMEVQEQTAVVRAALDSLSEEYRTALILKEMEGLKYEEIAEIVGCPVGTVRSRIHRARSDLREILRIQLKDQA